MNTFDLKIHLDNDAFVGEWLGEEVATILQGLVDQFKDAARRDLDRSFDLRDSNGNTVGSAHFNLDDDRDAAIARAQEKKFENFVGAMQSPDIRMTLENLCDINYPPDANRNQLFHGLVQALKAGDTNIEVIQSVFEGKY